VLFNNILFPFTAVLLLRELTFGTRTCNGDSYRRLESIIAKIEIPDVRIYLRMALLPAQFWEALEPTGKERRQNLHQKGTTMVHESFDVAQSPVYRKDGDLREETENVHGATLQERDHDSSYQEQLPVCVADSCIVTDETQRHFCYYRDLMEHAQSQDWDTCEVEDEPLLECVTRVVLAALLKHTGFLPGYNSKYVYILQFLELFQNIYCFAYPIHFHFLIHTIESYYLYLNSVL
jgi:hypothetical protein